MSLYHEIKSVHPKVLRDWTRVLLDARNVSEMLHTLGCRHPLLDRKSGYCPAYSKFDTACAFFLSRKLMGSGRLTARVASFERDADAEASRANFVECVVEYFEASEVSGITPQEWAARTRAVLGQAPATT